MLETVNLQEVKEKLVDKLRPSKWDIYLENFLDSDNMDKILSTLLADAMDNKRFTPKIKDLFNAFIECPFNDVKVVIIGQDPYPQQDVADGIAFSCSKTQKPEASLRYIFNSIKDTYDSNINTEDCDLRRWSHQGVLLLNTALTTTIGKPGSHQMLWKPFTASLIDSLVWNKSNNLVYVFMGKQAQEFAKLVPEGNCKILISHPASAAYNKQSKWDCSNVWNKVNECLKLQGKTEIKW